jgi:hypothetical protein
MSRYRAIAGTLGLLLAVAAAIALHDPPWIGSVTAGLREWQTDEHGTRFRWTTGRASFYVPGDATAITLPLRPLPPLGRQPISIEVRVDDRWLATLELPDPTTSDLNAWVHPTLPLPHKRTSRRYRRIDLRVRRWIEQFNLGVQLGVVEVVR